MDTMKATRFNEKAADTPLHANRVPEWVLPAVTVAALICDALLAGACFISAFVFRSGSPVLSRTAWAWSREFEPYAGILLFVILMRVILLAYGGAYRFAGAFSFIGEAIKVLRAVVIGSLLAVAVTFLFRGGFAFRDFSYSRGVFVIDLAFAAAAFLVFHLGLRVIQSWIRERGINLIPTLIVGTGVEGVRTSSELAERRYLGFRVVGFVGTPADESELPFPVVGTVDELAEIIRRHRIQEVIITDESVDNDKLFEAMMQLGRRRHVEFRFTPKLVNILPQKTSVEQIGVLPMVRLFREPLSDAERFVKRVSDILISLITLILTFPIWLAVAIAIKLNSPGKVLFRQERVGMDGRVFLCYKFRTMVADADEGLHREMYKKNITGDIEPVTGADTPIYGKVPDDPRITGIGRYLRRTSLDELPQLLNVLLGEMSVVGPRPPIPYEVEQYEAWHRKRLDMKPGITGLWQVSGRNRLTFEEMVKVDLYYIENWSLFLDLKIILLTLPAVFRGDGAR